MVELQGLNPGVLHIIGDSDALERGVPHSHNLRVLPIT